MGTKTRLPARNADLVIERSGGLCEARRPEVCNGRGEHLHHRRFRSGGEDHSPANLIHICDGCHTWIHQHKQSAIAVGWAISSHGGTPPEDARLVYRGRWAELTQDGSVDLEPIFYHARQAGLDPWESKEVSAK